ncbi:conserved hypothetical protein [Magnetospirillum molischianum DSM 120]|uniref:Uncharacterized protein n=1 Tax=Magnetospirillum molischianum DSM 120 TaxID=1150626 RepID=H8FVU1_MAGML|nr:conserved hypothetical protein [Magnetospirillum molischianum DSM 120]
MAPWMRFIPAGAGNGAFSIKFQLLLPVHPRRRGERVAMGLWMLPPHGSSPQARGTVRLPGS